MRTFLEPFAARPRLLFLFIGGTVIAASAAALLLVAPQMADHQAITELSLPAIVVAGFLDGFNP